MIFPKLPEDFRIDRENGFEIYHHAMQKTWDIDPAYPALQYIFERYELNLEQCLWLCWLYAVTYCTPTLFYIYNEFPDFEDIEIGRFQKWHDKNWSKLLYQTDKRHEKGKLVGTLESYMKVLNGRTQREFYAETITDDTNESYTKLITEILPVKGFGRLTIFMLAESLKRCLGYNYEPISMDIPNALSSRNGLCYAINHDKVIDQKLTRTQVYDYENEVVSLVKKLKENLYDIDPELTDIFSVETTFCAYKGLFRKKRYIGYYIDRLQYEIEKMENNVKTGVDFTPLWDFRYECLIHDYLGELNGWSGIRRDKAKIFFETGKLYGLEPLINNGIISFGER